MEEEQPGSSVPSLTHMSTQGQSAQPQGSITIQPVDQGGHEAVQPHPGATSPGEVAPEPEVTQPVDPGGHVAVQPHPGTSLGAVASQPEVTQATTTAELEGLISGACYLPDNMRICLLAAACVNALYTSQRGWSNVAILIVLYDLYKTLRYLHTFNRNINTRVQAVVLAAGNIMIQHNVALNPDVIDISPLQGWPEALLEMLLNDLVLVVCALIQALPAALAFYVFEKILQLLLKQFFRLQTLDDFTRLIVLAETLLFYHFVSGLASPVLAVVLWLAGCIIWWGKCLWAQHALIINVDWSKFISERAPVYIYGQRGATAADSGHIYVWIPGPNFLAEITKDRTQSSGLFAVVVPAPTHRNPRTGPWAYIPFFNYGVVGVTSLNLTELNAEYAALLNSIGTAYSASNNSCQEFAFEFATRVCQGTLSLSVGMTNLKTLVLLVGTPLFLTTFMGCF
eukprot:jgi/Chlat1/3797/Chrsp259S03929